MWVDKTKYVSFVKISIQYNAYKTIEIVISNMFYYKGNIISLDRGEG